MYPDLLIYPTEEATNILFNCPVHYPKRELPLALWATWTFLSHSSPAYGERQSASRFPDDGPARLPLFSQLLKTLIQRAEALLRLSLHPPCLLLFLYSPRTFVAC